MQMRGLLVLLLIAGCSYSHDTVKAREFQEQPRLVTVEGEVAGCFARTRVFTLVADIYAFDLREHADLFNELEGFPKTPPVTPDEIDEVLARRDSFIRSVKERATLAHRTRSDESGHYALSGLEQNAEYLLIAIVPPQEDYEEYFLVETTGPLSGENTTVNVWEGEIPKEQCHP